MSTARKQLDATQNPTFNCQEQLHRLNLKNRHSLVFTSEEVQLPDSVRVIVERDGLLIGNALTDNANQDDRNRFRDEFRFSYVAVLSWSPIARASFKLKRTNNIQVAEVEDGVY